MSRVEPVAQHLRCLGRGFAAAAPTRFTLNPTNDISPVWSPDGQRVSCSARTAPAEISCSASRQQAAARGAARQLRMPRTRPTGHLTADTSIFHQRWRRPTLNIEVTTACNAATSDTFVQHQLRRVRRTVRSRWQMVRLRIGRIGADAKSMFKRFPPSGEQMDGFHAGGGEPLWTRDGRELFYLAARRQADGRACDHPRRHSTSASRGVCSRPASRPIDAIPFHDVVRHFQGWQPIPHQKSSRLGRDSPADDRNQLAVLPDSRSLISDQVLFLLILWS